MEGGHVFVLEGDEAQLDQAWSIWREIRGSKLPPVPKYECAECPWMGCSYSPKFVPDIAEGIYAGPKTPTTAY